MSDALYAQSLLAPDKCAADMADGSAAMTYRELNERADRMAALFQQLGLSGGETIALLHENELSVLEWWWGRAAPGFITFRSGRSLPRSNWPIS